MTLSIVFLLPGGMAIGYYTSQRVGDWDQCGRIRLLGSRIRDGEVQHTGVVPFLKSLNQLSGAALRMELEEVQRQSLPHLAPEK